MRQIIKLLMEHKPALAAVFVFLMIQAACDLALPQCTASLVDNIVGTAALDGNTDVAAELLPLALTMIACAFGSMAANIGVGFFSARTGAKISRDLRRKLFSRVMSFSQAEVDSFSAASLITRGTNDIQQIQMVCTMLQRIVLYAPVLTVGGLIMVVRTNVSMMWIIALGIVAVLAACALLVTITMPKFKIMQKLVDKVNLVSREILTGLPVIRAFGREDHEEERFEDASRTLMNTQIFTTRTMQVLMPYMTVVMNVVSVLIVLVGSSFVDAGELQTGDLIAFISYSMIIIMSFLMISVLAIILPRAAVAADRVNEVINTEPSVKNPSEANRKHLLALVAGDVAADGADVDNVAAGEAAADDAAVGEGSAALGARIAFDHVCFRYSEESDNVLDDVSFVAPAGKTTAIVGSTGCGKSTVVKLIERFYDVQSGSVTIDGVDVRDLDQVELRSQLGYAPQGAFLFSGTIDSNISFADASMPQERKQLAASVAQALEFIEAKETGWETPVSQSGTNVSGGQRQRLSIARALASNARAYLFDDCFSALDFKTDAKLRSDLSQKLKGRTVVLVAQRIATVLNADNIVVLADGRVVGQGTHQQLMDGCPEYRDIALSQLNARELGVDEGSSMTVAEGGAR